MKHFDHTDGTSFLWCLPRKRRRPDGTIVERPKWEVETPDYKALQHPDRVVAQIHMAARREG